MAWTRRSEARGSTATRERRGESPAGAEHMDGGPETGSPGWRHWEPRRLSTPGAKAARFYGRTTTTRLGER